ncbi:hypothetical protein [Salinibacterium sp. ZJ450]|uniref:hypothetical protein n=1 Tax=Salinibacterium sp. ZJ450 TaxID=2708338 RepID=UPI001421DA2A|nr:hypothetical protein [Salinibacterium sp. ZJ450]
MSVAFTSDTGADAPLPTLDDLLRRVLTDRAADPSPTSRILATLTLALDRGFAPAAARRSILRLGSEPVRVVARSDRSWYRLVKAARSHIALVGSSASTPPGQLPAARLHVARSVVGHLLAPARPGVGVGKKAQVTARAALAVLGAQTLLDGRGYSNALASRDWLALQTNLTPGNAGIVLGNLVKLGWIKRQNSTSLGTARWSFTKLSRDEGDRAWAWADTIETLATGDYGADPLAELISEVPHPAFAYSEVLGMRAWLAAASGLGGVDPEVLGLTKRSARDLRRRVTAALPGLGAERLRPQLDAHAEESLAMFIKADRKTDLAQLVDERNAERARFAAEKAERAEDRSYVRSLLREVWPAVGDAPDSASTSEDIDAWTGRAARYFSGPGRIHDATLLPVARQLLTSTLERRGVLIELAADVVRRVLPKTETDYIASVEAVAGSVPANTSELQEWTTAAAAFMYGSGSPALTSDQVINGQLLLREQIIEAGHAERHADQVAQFVMRLAAAA